MDDADAAVTRVANKTTATRMPRVARARERGRASPAPSGRGLPADTPILLIAYRNDLCVFTRTSPSVGDLDVRSFNAASYTPWRVPDAPFEWIGGNRPDQLRKVTVKPSASEQSGTAAHPDAALSAAGSAQAAVSFRGGIHEPAGLRKGIHHPISQRDARGTARQEARASPARNRGDRHLPAHASRTRIRCSDRLAQ